MSAELAEINDFVKTIPPFDNLEESAIDRLTKSINIEYVRQGERMPPSQNERPHLYILRKGAISYFDQNDELLSKYSEGDLCSVFMLPDENVKIRVEVDEDTLLYSVPKPDLFYAIQDSQEANAFFNQSGAQRLQKRMQKFCEDAVVSSTLTNACVEDFYNSPASAVSHDTSIQDTAILMSDLGYSCLMVTKDKEMEGIVTDKDIRRRVVAAGLDTNKPVSEIMTKNVLTLDVKSSAFDALAAMTSKSIHHLPITRDGKLDGLVTVTDLMNHEGNNAVNLTNLIRRAKSIEELSKLSGIIPKLQLRMAKLGTSAEHVGKSISVITMALTLRLIKMAEQILGQPPVPYAWLSAGSQARQEQLSHSDQDNALIIDDSMLPEHDKYFSDLATFVSDGLNKCGFIYCPGNVMATNPKWRQPKAVWDKYFSTWVDNPEPHALLHSSIFFDLATVYGDESLLRDVRRKMLKKTQKNSVFIAYMSKNALSHKPPLGFFRDFVLVEKGNNEKALDLKHNGIVPIVDLARIYALQEGIEEVNTLERLHKAAGTKSLNSKSGRNLIDAFEFLGQLRMEHQANLIQEGKEPSNYMHPRVISRLEREHLKDAFKVIKTLQDSRQVAF
ncbi:MAG: putative nucleotidyltransferase substrate binding domain-containing protein [Pseudomonadota bacterium]